MNGVSIRRLSGSPEDITIQSTVQGTRRLTPVGITPQSRDAVQELRIGGNELVAIKANAKGVCYVEFKGLGGSDGALVVEQCGIRDFLSAGHVCRRWIAEGMTVFLRAEQLRMPDGRYML